MIDAPTRPALRYLGGKWRLAPRIIAHFPKHRVYVEPYGGAASVLLQKPRSYAEVYNDLDDEVVNLFRVLRDADQADQLVAALRLTPFARTEFEDAYSPTYTPVEQARRLIARSFMGHGSTATAKHSRTSFRSNARRTSTIPAHDWASYPPALAQIVERLRGVVIERRPALDVMRWFDGPDSLIFADPPYVHATRSRKTNKGALQASYLHEMDDTAHAELLDCLNSLQGMVALCGYPSALYDARLKNWRRIEMSAYADGARPRTEVLWLNPAACKSQDLFGSAA